MVTRRRIIVMKAFVAFLMLIATGLSSGAVFSYGDFNKDNKNTLQIEIRIVDGFDKAGAILCIVAFLILPMSIMIQLIAGKAYKDQYCCGQCYDMVALLFGAFFAILSSAFLLGFLEEYCNENRAFRAVNDLQDNPKQNITVGGTRVFVRYRTYTNNGTRAEVSDASDKVVPPMIAHCRRELKYGFVVSAAVIEILCAFLILAVFIMAAKVKDGPIHRRRDAFNNGTTGLDQFQPQPKHRTHHRPNNIPGAGDPTQPNDPKLAQQKTKAEGSK